jgi:hypothetical protein
LAETEALSTPLQRADQVRHFGEEARRQVRSRALPGQVPESLGHAEAGELIGALPQHPAHGAGGVADERQAVGGRHRPGVRIGPELQAGGPGVKPAPGAGQTAAAGRGAEKPGGLTAQRGFAVGIGTHDPPPPTARRPDTGFVLQFAREGRLRLPDGTADRVSPLTPRAF